MRRFEFIIKFGDDILSLRWFQFKPTAMMMIAGLYKFIKSLVIERCVFGDYLSIKHVLDL